MFASKLDVFIYECSLAGYLKDNADVLAGTPRGSGIKAVRGLSDRKEDDKKAAYLQKASQFEMLCNEGQESLEERFEREALKNLGGSIAFVSKKKVLWGDEDQS